MARDFNQNRNTNATLGSGRVSGYGNHWSLVDGLDGWNKVYVGTPNLPSNIKEYLEGNPTLSVYATPQNIDKLHQYAFAGFPNLVDLYLLKEGEIVELDDNFLGGVSSLQHIYVPSDLLGDSSTQDTYLGEYNGKTFASLFTAIPSILEWTITPSEIGSDTLTESNFNDYISTLTDRIKNAVGQLNLNGFTNGVSFAWSYDFSNVFPSLEDIYIDNTKVDFSTWTIEGSGTLTSAIVESSLQQIPSDKISGITKLIIANTFDLESVCIILSNYDLSALTNLNENIYYGSNSCKGIDFATDSVETIKLSAWLDSNCPYNIGDTRNVVYNNETYTLRICDKTSNRYELTNYSGKYNKLVIEFVELVLAGQVNTTNTNSGGWALSYVKQTTMPTIYNNLPSDLKAVISQVRISSANGGSDATGLSYSDNYLFLPNVYEITGTKGGSNALEQTTQYGLYSINNNGTFRIKKFINNNAKFWWLRSPYSTNLSWYCGINTAGNASDNISNDGSCGISPFFCI